MIIEFNEFNAINGIGLFTNRALFAIELIFIIASTIEIILKLIADGMILAPDGLISDFADFLHLLIYVISLVYVIWQPRVILRYSAAYWYVQYF